MRELAGRFLLSLLLTGGLATPAVATQDPPAEAATAAAKASDEDRAALEAARALLAEFKDDASDEGVRNKDAITERIRILEDLIQTIDGRASLPDPEALAARAAELEAELVNLRAAETPTGLTLTASEERAKYDQAAKAAAAELVSAQSAVDALATRRSEGEKELAGLPDRSERAQARSVAVEGADDAARYIAETARYELRLAAERANYLTQALAAWEDQEPVLRLELEKATLEANRAAALDELAAAEASRLREIEAAAARREADAEDRRAARESDPIERFRLRARADAAHLRAEAAAFKAVLDELGTTKQRERELLDAVKEDKEGLNQRLELRQRGIEVLLLQHLDRCRRGERLIADVTLPELDAALDENESLLAEALDRLWNARLPAEENRLLAALLEEAGADRADEAQSAFAASLEEDGLIKALELRADQLEAAGRDYSEILRLVGDRRKLLAEFEDYISGRMLWTRTAPTIDGAALSKAWTELANIPAPYREDGTWRRLRKDAFSRLPVVLLALGLIVGLHFVKRRSSTWRDLGSGRSGLGRFGLRAGVGLAWTAAPPLQIWVAAWAVHSIGGPEAFDPPVGHLLEYQAMFVLARRAVRLVLGHKGLLVGDHAIPPKVGLQVTRSAVLLTTAGQVLYAPYRVLQGDPFHMEVFPRLLYVGWAFCAGVSLLLLLRRGGAVIQAWTVEGGLLRSILRYFAILAAVALVPVLALDLAGYRVGAERTLVNELKIFSALFALGGLFRVLERVGTLWVERSRPPLDADEERVVAARRVATRAVVRVAALVIVILLAFFLKHAWDIGDPLARLLIETEFQAVQVRDGVYLTAWDVMLSISAIAIGHILAGNLRQLHEGLVAPFAGTSDEGSKYAYLTLLRYATFGVSYAVALLTLGFSFETLGWFATAASVGLGFGLQEIVANFISGLILLFERPVRVGDIVSIGSTSGTVDSISMRATTITNWERQTIIVPNKKFVTENLTNWTHHDKVMRRELDVRVAYGSDVETVLRGMHDVVTGHPAVLADPAPILWFQRFGLVGMEFKVLFYTSIDVGLGTRSDIHAAILNRFREDGIEIPVVSRLEDTDVTGTPTAPPPLAPN